MHVGRDHSRCSGGSGSGSVTSSAAPPSVPALRASTRSLVTTWLADRGSSLRTPLAAEVWVFDPELDRVLLVEHRWRRWVPPGGKVESGGMPRAGAVRKLFEETGLRVQVHDRPAAVAFRSYHPDWPATLGLSYAAVADPSAHLVGEPGHAVAWTPLDTPWVSAFPDDVHRMRAYVDWRMRAGSDP